MWKHPKEPSLQLWWHTEWRIGFSYTYYYVCRDEEPNGTWLCVLDIFGYETRTAADANRPSPMVTFETCHSASPAVVTPVSTCNGSKVGHCNLSSPAVTDSPDVAGFGASPDTNGQRHDTQHKGKPVATKDGHSLSSATLPEAVTAPPVEGPRTHSKPSSEGVPSPQPVVWQCLNCTLENSISSQYCVVCDTPKPSPGSAQV
jgi:hypothetical protein